MENNKRAAARKHAYKQMNDGKQGQQGSNWKQGIPGLAHDVTGAAYMHSGDALPILFLIPPPCPPLTPFTYVLLAVIVVVLLHCFVAGIRHRINNYQVGPSRFLYVCCISDRLSVY